MYESLPKDLFALIPAGIIIFLIYKAIQFYREGKDN